MTSRVKQTESFRKKIADKKYPDPLRRTRDLLGVRIVCLYPSVLEDMDTVIRETFTVLHHEDKGKGPSPELWRYSSVHYDCKIPDDGSGRRYDNIKNLVFEVQVRTILQDAWATVEHKLGYKNEENQIPDELKREFSALAGPFHVADQRFQFIANQMRDRAQDVAARLADHYRLAIDAARQGDSVAEDALAVDKQIKKLESRSDALLNRGTVKALLHGIYRGREHARNNDYSLLAQDLESAGIDSLGALGGLLRSGDSAAREAEREQTHLSDVDFARSAIAAVGPEFRHIRPQRRKR